uniref:Uncharacterized protein n=1 Tax=Caulobacter sp. (strain K31) TaxID=366602 RepID=B0T9I7_CAUSK
MLVLLLISALLVGELGPETRARLAPFTAAVAEARSSLAALGQEASVKARLEAMRTVDQRPITIANHEIDLSGLAPEDQAAARKIVSTEIKALNTENVSALVSLVPTEGWFSSKTYGQQAATGAFLIVQHADTPLQKRFLPAIEAMAQRNEALWSEYALMYDRVAVAEGRLQRYGTQMHCVDGRMVPQPTEAPDQLDVRRAPMGFRWPNYAGYLANFGACQN